MITILLIVHALLAVALLGVITHQAVAVWWPGTHAKTFVTRMRSVSAPTYTSAVIVLFLATFIVGGLIYPAYRLSVRQVLEDYRLHAANGSFELKEHWLAIGAGLLPAYWYVWKQPLTQTNQQTRAMITAILAFVVWWGFIVGHVLNNIRGFGT